ncbi:hypothetical protein GQ54DRAFT_265390 [Martensiomyces pterosporus]|nr:hypothetical protein GQ54DRAFT_265390 [Martensiomyces pterosporus]
MHHGSHKRAPSESDAEDSEPLVATHMVDGVEITRDRAIGLVFANQQVLEALIAKVCKRAHIRAVSADVAPYLSFALQDRLRSFMELVSAAAYHRTRTQTLPPPPLDPLTRLPLYRITPHLDVKKQLAVIERVDRMREQTRERLLSEREQKNHSHLAGSDAGDQSKGLPSAKRHRKKDDGSSDAPVYTNKNMPDDVRNRISNQTALRAAGGIRKSWMNASTPDWLISASASKSTARTSSGAKPPQPALASDPRPPPLLSHRHTSLSAPLLITVRDCLFSLERERLSSVRVGRGGGERVLIQAYTKYVHD